MILSKAAVACKFLEILGFILLGLMSRSGTARLYDEAFFGYRYEKLPCCTSKRLNHFGFPSAVRAASPALLTSIWYLQFFCCISMLAVLIGVNEETTDPQWLF